MPIPKIPSHWAPGHAHRPMAYTRKIGMDLEGQNLFAEAKLRAERRAGELLKGMEKAKGKRTDLVPKGNQVGKKTLNDLGVTKKESSNWQKLADVPIAKIRKYVSATNKENKAEVAIL